MGDIWKALLRKYIAHILDCEGTAFLPSVYDDPDMRVVHFDEGERAKLEVLEQEAVKEYYGNRKIN